MNHVVLYDLGCGSFPSCSTFFSSLTLHPSWTALGLEGSSLLLLLPSLPTFWSQIECQLPIQPFLSTLRSGPCLRWEFLPGPRQAKPGPCSFTSANMYPHERGGNVQTIDIPL